MLAAVIAQGVTTRAWPGASSRVVVSLGIVGDCAVLAAAEFGGAHTGAAWPTVGLALGASVAVGVASAMMAASFKTLAEAGWTSASILAHRFYLTIVVALGWLMSNGPDALPPTDALPAVRAVSAVAVLLSLLLFQLALRRADTVTVLICMAVQPVVSFGLSLLSPVYEWSSVTLAGVLVVTGALVLDIHVQRREKPRPEGGAARSVGAA